MFSGTTARLNMAMRRPDGLPLHGDTVNYALCDTPTFTGDTGLVHGLRSIMGTRTLYLTRYRPTGVSRRIYQSGTVVVAGPTRESIQVLVPDCTIPPVRNNVRIDLRHVVYIDRLIVFSVSTEMNAINSLLYIRILPT